MSAAVFLVEGDNALDPDCLVLAGPEGRHAATVARLQPGESVDVVNGRGRRARCQVLKVGKDRVDLDVMARHTDPEPALRVILVQGLAKGPRSELAVELATEVGVDEIVPWSAARCVVQWKGARGDKHLTRWRATAREAGKQSRRARFPLVHPLCSTAQLGQVLAGATVLILHEEATEALSQVGLPATGTVAVIVGPEGGIAPGELATVPGRSVRLGPQVLRTSSAGAAAVAVLNARTDRW